MHLDIETRSAAELRIVGAHNYSCDETTDVLCLCVNDGTGSDLWRPSLNNAGGLGAAAEVPPPPLFVRLQTKMFYSGRSIVLLKS